MDIFSKMKIAKALKNCEEFFYSNQVFNVNQCKNLVYHLSNFVQRFQELFELDTRAFQPLLIDVYKVSSKAEMLVQSCSQTWPLAPLFQMQNKEAFRELLLEMASCWEVLFDIASNIESCLKGMENIVGFQSCVTNFLPCDLVEVEEDQDELCKILENKLHNLHPGSNDYKLAKYVLQWRKCILKVESGESELITFLPNVPLPDFGEIPITIGNEKNIFLTKWLGIENITKKIDLNLYDEIDFITVEKEVRIMAQLNHPNIIKLFYCGSFKDFLGKNLLQFGMEKGEISLRLMLFGDPKQRILKQRITFHAKLDIMQQIVSGVLYLHDMKVAHRDLKPSNVVVNKMQCLELKNDGYVCVKLIDFGISKHEVKDDILVMSSGIRGSRVYIAPEAAKANIKFDPLKTDVFSFGLICCDILLRKEYEDIRYSPFEIAKRQKRALMGLPFCQELRSLIEDCLSMDPNGRPSFAKIYTRLMEIKKKDIKTRCISKTLMREDQTFSHFNLFTQFSFPILTIGQWWLYIWRLIVYCLWAFVIDFVWKSYVPKINDEYIKGIIDSSTFSKCCGLDFKIKTLEKFLQNKSMVGVIGASGIGKTTLVKALKDHLNKASNDSSTWTTIMCDLKSDYLMEMNRILKELGQKEEAKDLVDGKVILVSMLQQKKVIFILDDVIEEHQLDMFLEAEMFSIEGSKLIVTSRDWKILKGMINEDSKFEVPILDYDQSIEIFSKYAFKNECSMIPHMNQLSKKIVNACSGHPLSLEVISSSLNGQKRLRVWERALQRLERGEYDTSEDLGRRLEISFDMLRDEEKELFLDISCFFCKDVWFEDIREDTIVDYFDDNTKTIIASLKDNSLIKIDHGGFISMHDSIRDMGRRISRKRLGGRRMWKQTFKSLETSKKEEFQNARGICITRVKKEIDLDPIEKIELPELLLLNIEALNDLSNVAKLIKKTHRLKFLWIIYKTNDIDYGDILSNPSLLTTLLELQELRQLTVLQLQNVQLMKTFPNTTIDHMPLKTLHLQECHNLTNISHEFQNITSLTSLYIQSCTKLTSLTTLNFKGCEQLEEIPLGIPSMSCLQWLGFEGCKKLKVGHASFENLKALKILSFEGCKVLENMPHGLGTLVSLKEVYFTDCKQLKIADSELESLRSLTTLNFKGCEQLEVIPLGIASMSSLQWLGFVGCKKLRVGHASFENLKVLRILSFRGCEVLENVPLGLEKFASLEELYLNDCKQLKIVDSKIEALTSLTKLNFKGCEQLEEIPLGIANMLYLQWLGFEGCKKLKAGNASFENLNNLRILSFRGCEALEKMPHGMGKLASLEELYFVDCKQLKIDNSELESLTSLIALNFKGCKRLEEIPLGIANMSCLQLLGFKGCKKLRVPGHVSFENLTALKSLSFTRCELLENMPHGLGKLIFLEEIYFSDCKQLKIDNLELKLLTLVTKLNFKGCEQLEEIPPTIANMSCLQWLSFEGCKKLKVGYASFENLKALRALSFEGCQALENMPHGLGKLVFLKEVYFNDCKQLKIDNSELESLTSVTTLNFKGCEQLEEIPLGIANMSCLQKLGFGGCKKLRVGNASFENLKALRFLNFEGCEVLENMPYGLGTLVSLKEFHFTNCKQMKIANSELESLTSLTTLNFKECEQLEEIPLGIANMSCLQWLSFEGCKKLKVGHVSFENLKALTILNFEGCEALENLPHGLGTLVSLKEVHFSDCKKLKIGNSELESLTSLTTLNFKGCEQVEEIPLGIANMSCLQKLGFVGCKKLRAGHASFENFKALRILSFEGCEVLENMPHRLGTLVSLKEVYFTNCKQLKIDNSELESLTSLTTLSFKECEQLEEIPLGIANMSYLQWLGFEGCKKLRVGHASFENLKALTILNFEGCVTLETIPHGLGRLVSLKAISFNDCKKLKIDNSKLESLTSLTALNFKGCDQLEEIPVGIVNMSCLQWLSFEGCKKLKVGHASFENLKALKILSFEGCEALENVPHGLETLASLEEVYFCHCQQLKISDSELKSLTSLATLNFKGCGQLIEKQLARLQS